MTGWMDGWMDGWTYLGVSATDLLGHRSVDGDGDGDGSTENGQDRRRSGVIFKTIDDTVI